MNSQATYRLPSLSQLDVRQLTAMEGGEAFVVEKPTEDAHRHNELATLALVGGLTLLGTAAAYYFGKSEKEEIVLKVEEIRSDGSIRRIDLKVNRSSKEPVENQIMKALAQTTQTGG